MRIAILALALLVPFASRSQTPVQQTLATFSDGPHATFMVEFDGSDAGMVESWYKGQLKDLSRDIENKKEIRATGARVPEVSPDTITVLCKTEQLRKSANVMLHLAFKVNGTYVAASSEKRMVEGASNFAYVKAVAYKKYLLQNQLTEAEKILARLQSELATLEKDQHRYEDNIEKTRQKGTEAATGKVQEEAALETNELAVRAKQNEVHASPSEANTKALQDLLKEQAKIKDRIDRLGSDAVNAEKKIKDLEFAIQRNFEDQETKRATIEKQTAAVEELRVAVAVVN